MPKGLYDGTRDSVSRYPRQNFEAKVEESEVSPCPAGGGGGK
jgi:hypothetical protein